MRAVRRLAGWLGWAVVWLLIIAGLAITIVPRFLDHIYYEGPESGHFDGARFFNPDGEDMFRPPAGARGGSRGGFILRWLTGQDGRAVWPDRVAVQPANIRALPPLRSGEMRATWVGHATVLIETPGFTMLTDPIWSDVAGPFGIGPGRVAAPGVRMADLPKIDLIVISHNHYDHMDLDTLRTLWERDRPTIVTSLGNDAVIASNGVPAVALDWGEKRAVGAAMVRVTRNHHWGSRWGVDRNRALWSSFTIDTPSGRVFFAGDTGFGDGRWPGEAVADGITPRFAILPIGAFRFAPGQMGTGSHIGPPEAVKVWNRLGRPQALGIHWGTFQLSSEAYDTPPRMLDFLMRCASNDEASQRFATWRIGEPRLVPGPGLPTSDVPDGLIDECVTQPEVQRLR